MLQPRWKRYLGLGSMQNSDVTRLADRLIAGKAETEFQHSISRPSHERPLECESEAVAFHFPTFSALAIQQSLSPATCRRDDGRLRQELPDGRQRGLLGYRMRDCDRCAGDGHVQSVTLVTTAREYARPTRGKGESGACRAGQNLSPTNLP